MLITPAMSFFSSGIDVSESLLNNEHFTPVLKNVSKKFRAYGITEDFGLLDFGMVFFINSGKSPYMVNVIMCYEYCI